ncbi:actinodefensin-associated protein B [Streptomyces sp. AHA2]|uniref:actinodefensin-associated protein B n=1 Tax=Streptomyces sp. AHA2 TaxID=3064526 RepID=UPI002FE3858E
MPTPHALPRLAPQVRMTPLPFGGAVLVHASTLRVAECGEQEARVVERLLSHGLPGAGTGPAGEAVRRMSRQLADDGWLVVPPDPDDVPPCLDDPDDGVPPASGDNAPATPAAPGTDPSALTPAETPAPDTDRR